MIGEHLVFRNVKTKYTILRSISLSLILVTLLILSSCIQTSNFNRGHFIPNKVQPISIPFELVNELIVIKAIINGVEGRFLFDNGFSLSAVNQEFSNRAGINFSNTANIVDANNQRAKTLETTVDTVYIQGQIFKETGFYKIDTSAFFPCSPIDGIIGASIINKANWQIDFASKTMHISSKAFDSSGSVLDVEFSNNNSSFVNILVKDKHVRAKIDFGKTTPLDLRKDKFKQLFVGEDAQQRTGIMSLSANGLSKVKTNYYLNNSYQISSEDNKLKLKAKVRLIEKLKYEAYIGIDFFRDSLVTLNLLEHQYIVSDITQSKAMDDGQSNTKKSYPLSIYLVNGEWKVISLDPNNEALQNIELLSTIENIDNLPISRFKSICEYRDYIKQKLKSEQDLRITLFGDDNEIKLSAKQPNISRIQ